MVSHRRRTALAARQAIVDRHDRGRGQSEDRERTPGASLVGPAKEATVKDIRCMIGLHAWVKRQVEDSQYKHCRRCDKDAPVHVHMSPGGGWGA